MERQTAWEGFINWGLVCPPNRPPAYFVELCRAALERLDPGSRVAVLGSTPELVDVANERTDLRVTVFDRSQEFYALTTELRYTARSERFVHGDWLETLPKEADHYDVILSDLTLGNVPYDEQAAFTAAVGMALAQGGLVLDRVLANSHGMKPMNELVQRYRRTPANLLTLNAFNSEFLFTSELVEQAGIVDSSRIQDHLLLNYGDENSPMSWFSRNVHRITPRGSRWSYGRRWHELSDSYFPGLEIATVAKEPPGSPYFGYVRVHEIRRRK